MFANGRIAYDFTGIEEKWLYIQNGRVIGIAITQ